MSDVDAKLDAIEGMTDRTLAGIRELQRERDEALAERDRARGLACRLEEELALIRRSLSKAHRL